MRKFRKLKLESAFVLLIFISIGYSCKDDVLDDDENYPPELTELDYFSSYLDSIHGDTAVNLIMFDYVDAFGDDHFENENLKQYFDYKGGIFYFSNEEMPLAFYSEWMFFDEVEEVSREVVYYDFVNFSWSKDKTLEVFERDCCRYFKLAEAKYGFDNYFILWSKSSYEVVNAEFSASITQDSLSNIWSIDIVENYKDVSEDVILEVMIERHYNFGMSYIVPFDLLD